MMMNAFALRPHAIPRSRSASRLAFLLASAFVVVSAGLAQVPPKTGAGAAVPVVKNGKSPVAPASGPRFALELLWTIGGEGAPPEQDFSGVEAVAVDPTGTVLVLDSKESRVLTFDGKGVFVRAFGRKGQGPGELSLPIGIAQTPAGEIMVEDSGNRRLSYYSRDGKFLRQQSTAQPGMGMGLAGLVMDRKGRMAGRTMSFEGGKIGFEIKSFDKDLKPGAPLAKLEMALFGAGKIDIMSMMPGMLMAPDERGRLYIGSSKGYRIQTFDFEGKPLRIVERAYDPVPLKKEDHEKFFKILGGIQATGGFSVKEMILVPEVFPAYSAFVVDQDGRILVRTYERGKGEKEYFNDLFDAEGRYAARFPSFVEFMLWRDGRLYGVQEDEAGFKVLKCFRVIG
jgi:DNA-binding beta-propeller fold protein YncE